MNEILFDVLLFAVIICTTLITSTIVPYVKEQIKGSQFKSLLDEVARAVRTAEQIVVGEKQGKAKKAQVVAYLSGWLLKHKIIITEEQLNTLIEAAVYSMNNE